ncbi:MAG TPA: twin-arginine translocase TatA/TatE family subunit [Terriglobales bacterium]|nr:twin-arginine translocase TatA/TatE family subunit [Terriglobales bacterium]
MNLGLTEMIFLTMLGLLLFGPKKLPEIGRKLGKVMAEFKRASNEFQSQLNDEVQKLERETEEKTPSILPPNGTTARAPASLTNGHAEPEQTALGEPERQNG